MKVEEGSVDVGDASLCYRLVRGGPSQPVLVFENGWGASYHYWAWVQRELAPHATLLFYNRAGIGGSTTKAPNTAQKISVHFDALLTALKIAGPVFVVGQSYGGLMCALHAAQKPERVRGIVQVDATPDRSHPTIDRVLGLIGKLTHFTILLARVGIQDPTYAGAARQLPPEEGRRMMQVSFGSVPSLRNALHELGLVGSIRDAIARGSITAPRLVISAGTVTERTGVLWNLIAPPEKARAIVTLMAELHRAQAAHNGRWISLPFTHGDLVFKEQGAAATAQAVLEFARV